MLEAFVTSFHAFFNFLTTSEGTLFRFSIETLLLLLIFYMAVSEYLRTRTRQMFWFTGSILLLTAIRATISVILALKVFGDGSIDFYHSLFPLFAQIMEVMAIFWLYRGILYFQKKRLPYTYTLMGSMVLVGLCVYPLWEEQRFSIYYGQFLGAVPLLLIEFLLLMLCMRSILDSKNILAKAYLPVIIAFSIGPLITLFNVLLFSGMWNLKFHGAIQPFFLLSIVFLGRALYHTLVNKAILVRALQSSRNDYEKAKELNAVKDAFLSTVSHELRTPLTSMKLYNSFLLHEEMGSITPEQKKATQIIDSEIERLSTLINDLLDYSKLQAGKAPLHLERFDMVALLRNSPHNALGSDKNVTVHFNTPEDLFVLADKDKIHQLYINLLSNAVKFSPEGEVIEVSVYQEGDSIHLRVQDHGSGIPEEKKRHLFQPFYQAHNGKGGTGLGLAICKRIALLHSGDITLSSTGDGTIAEFIFQSVGDARSSSL